MPTNLTSLCTCCSVLALHAAIASAQITVGPRTVTAELTRTWYQEPLLRQTVVATNTIVAGPITIPTSTPNPSQMTLITVYGTIMSASGQVATGNGDISSSSTLISHPDFFQLGAGAGIGAGGLAPPFGQMVVSAKVTHALDFQTTTELAWSSVTFQPLDTLNAHLVILRDPGLVSQSTVFDRLFTNTSSPSAVYQYADGTLIAGSYRVTIELPGGDASYGAPGSFFGSEIGGALTFSIPSPAPAALLSASSLVILRRRERAHLYSHCRYDRTGLQPHSPCPECGKPPAP